MEFRGVLKNYILHRKHSPNLGHSSRNGRAQFEVLVLFFLAAGSENLERTNIQPRICLTVSSTFDDLALCVCVPLLASLRHFHFSHVQLVSSLFCLRCVFDPFQAPCATGKLFHPRIAIIYKNPKNALSAVPNPCLVDNYSKFGKPHHLISISDFCTRSRPSFLETSLQSPPMNHTRASAPMFSGSHSSR